MADCPPKTPATGCLDVTIQESIILPNFNVQNSFNSFTVCGIKNYVTRTEVIDYQWSEDSLTDGGIGIIGFVDNKQSLTPGSFVNSDVKYIRITNLPDSDKFASIFCIKTNDESETFKVDPGASLILSNDAFEVTSSVTASFDYMSEIKAMAGDSSDPNYTGSIQIEYVVASS